MGVPDHSPKPPFADTVDPDVFYRSPIHETVCAELFAATKTHGGLLVLSGEPGTGKTTVLRRLARELEQAGGRVLWCDEVLSLHEMFRPVNGEPGGLNEATPAETLLATVQARVHLDRATVVAVDEAQRLEPVELGILRDLAEAGRGTGRPVTVLLVGLPGLDTKLTPLVRNGANGTSAFRVRLSRLETPEVRAYMAYRLAQAGLPLDQVFQADAVERVAAYAEGIPRVINYLCAGALHCARQAGLPMVSASAVDTAARWLDRSQPVVAPLARGWHEASRGETGRPVAVGRRTCVARRSRTSSGVRSIYGRRRRTPFTRAALAAAVSGIVLLPIAWSLSPSSRPLHRLAQRAAELLPRAPRDWPLVSPRPSTGSSTGDPTQAAPSTERRPASDAAGRQPGPGKAEPVPAADTRALATGAVERPQPGDTAPSTGDRPQAASPESTPPAGPGSPSPAPHRQSPPPVTSPGRAPERDSPQIAPPARSAESQMARLESPPPSPSPSLGPSSGMARSPAAADPPSAATPHGPAAQSHVAVPLRDTQTGATGAPARSTPSETPGLSSGVARPSDKPSAAPAEKTGKSAPAPGAAPTARPIPGPDDRPQVPPWTPSPGPGSAIAALPPPPALPSSDQPRPSGSATGPAPSAPSDKAVPAPSPSTPSGARAGLTAPTSSVTSGAPSDKPALPSSAPSGASSTSSDKPALAAPAPSSSSGASNDKPAPAAPLPTPPAQWAVVARSSVSAAESPTREPSGGLGIQGAPPPGAPGGPLAPLASVRPDEAAIGRSGGGLDPGAAGTGPSARTLDTVGRAVIRVLLLSPADGRKPVAAGQPAAQVGLGFLVDGRGYVLTHDELIREGRVLNVALADGRNLPVKQIWRDQLAGVAVLRIEASGLPAALPLGQSGALRVGDPAVVVGWPSGAQPPATARASIRATGSATGGNLVLDAPISAESVGSPLVDLRGQVVGIAATDAPVTDERSRGGFAIPIDRAKAMLRQALSSATAQARPTVVVPVR
jgi:S1-C subfamily serine protease/type II secretory pathway predicted ATPase ExeA